MGAQGGGKKDGGAKQKSILHFFRAPTPAAAAAGAAAAAAPAAAASGGAACEDEEERQGKQEPVPSPSSRQQDEKEGRGEAAGDNAQEQQQQQQQPASPPQPQPAAAAAAGMAPPPPPEPAAAAPPAAAAAAAAEQEEEVEEEMEEMGDGLTDFERARLERIKENQAFLASLGLHACKPSALMRGSNSDKPKPKKKKRPAPSSFASAAAAASLPVRRSTRQRGPPLSSYSDIEAAAAAAAAAMEEEAEPEPPEEEVDYDDSTVLKYLCCTSSSSLPAAPSAFFGSKGQGGGSKTSSDDTGPLKGFRVHSSPGPALCDPALSAVYSLHLQPPTAPASGAAPLLAAAGKQGRIAIFSTAGAAAATSKSPEGEEEEGEGARGLLMSYRGHGGWVADVRFLASPSSSSTALLVSAGNDASIKLWDLSRAHPTTKAPRAVASLDHVHSKGVFSMDARGSLIATGSKDATVALLRLFPDGTLTEERRLEDLQDSVIKCVRFAPSSSSPHDDDGGGGGGGPPRLLALSGDDRDVRIVDLRCGGGGGNGGKALAIPGAHARTVHTLRWHPTEEHLLLTVGLDPHVRLWDLRKLPPPGASSSTATAAVDPLVSYFGHVSSVVKKQGAITPAEFYDGGKYVLIAGEGSQRLSVYDTSTGQAVSRGLLASEISQMAVLEGGGGRSEYRPSLLVAERKGAIGQFDPF